MRHCLCALRFTSSVFTDEMCPSLYCSRQLVQASLAVLLLNSSFRNDFSHNDCVTTFRGNNINAPQTMAILLSYFYPLRQMQ